MYMKTRTNVSIDSELLSEARNMNISISAVAEGALRVRLAEEKEKAWKKENKEAIDKYNQQIDETCVFSEDMRTF